MRSLTISTFPDAFSRFPRHVERSWSDLTEELAHFPERILPYVCTNPECPQRFSSRGAPGHHSAAPGACPGCQQELVLHKARLPALSFATYVPDGTRRAADVIRLDGFVADIDDGTDPEVVHRDFEDVTHLVYSTASHTPERPRTRLVVPFARPVEASLWLDVWTILAERIPYLDRHCKDPCRLFFRPAVVRDLGGLVGRDYVPEVLSTPRSTRWLQPPIDEATKLADQRVRQGRMRRRRRHGPVMRRALPPRLRRAEQERLLTRDANARRDLGLRLGGVVHDSGAKAVVRGVPCPGCGRPSVWWWVAPGVSRGWRCNHRNSCGEWGRLSDLEFGVAS